MLKKILKILLWLWVSVIGLVLILIVAVYIPPVQRIAVNKISAILSRSTGYDISVGKLRIAPPLRLIAEDALVRTTEADTVARLGRLDVDVMLSPLFTGRLKARQISLEDMSVNYADTVSAMALKGRIDKLALFDISVRPARSRAIVHNAMLSGVDLEAMIGAGTDDKDTTTSEPLKWEVVLGVFDMNDVKVALRMLPDAMDIRAEVEKAGVRKLSLDLGRQDVDAGHIGFINSSFIINTASAAAPDKEAVLAPADVPGTESLPWTVRVGTVELQNNAVTYAARGHVPSAGFDPQYIALSALNMKLDSVYNRSSDIALHIGELSFAERSGLEVISGSGDFGMDSTGIRLRGLTLRTPGSRLTVSANAGEGVIKMDRRAKVAADVDMSLSMRDVFRFVEVDRQVQNALTGETFTLKGTVAGTLGSMNISSFAAALTNYMNMTASGSVGNVTQPDNLRADINLRGAFTNLERLKNLIADSTLRERLSFPDRIRFGGDVRAANGTYSPQLGIAVDTGRLLIAADVNPRTEHYSAKIRSKGFPLDKFLPHDSIGHVTFRADISGRGFDPRLEGASANVDFSLDSLRYKGFTYSDIKLKAALADHKLNGTLVSGSDALNLNLDLSAEVNPDSYRAALKGNIKKVDLQRMGFVDYPFDISTALDARLYLKGDSVLKASVKIDTLRLTRDGVPEEIPQLLIAADASGDHVTANVRSGDLKIDFSSRNSIAAISAGFSAVARVVSAQIQKLNIDMLPVQQVLPQMNLTVTAGKNNMLRKLLKARTGSDFDSVSLVAYADTAQPFRADIDLFGVRTNGIKLDTVRAYAYQRESALRYGLHVANKPTTRLTDMARIELDGQVRTDTMYLALKQKNFQGKAGFDFVIGAIMRDTTIRLSIYPKNPTLGYNTWNVNDGNYISFNFASKRMFADMHLTDGSQSFELLSYPLPRMEKGAVKFLIKGLSLERALSVLPSPPQIRGTLNSDIVVGLHDGYVISSGTIEVDSLVYGGNAVGDVEAKVGFLSDGGGSMGLQSSLRLNSDTVAVISGRYPVEGEMKFRMRVPSLPLAAVNPFMPEGTATLNGNMHADIRVTGNTKTPVFDGFINFSDGSVTMPLTATTFRISPDSMTIRGSRLAFNNFSLISPNNQPLTFSGSLDFRDLAHIAPNINIRARNFQAVNSRRGRGNDAYGTAALNVDVNVTGFLNRLRVRGDIRLLSSTNLVYTLPDSPLSAESREQNILKFVSFAEIDSQDDMPRKRVETDTWTTDVSLSVGIDDNVSLTVNLSSDGNSRAELTGSGNLAFTMNTQGDMRLMGRYNVGSGFVVYSLPIVGPKSFNISEGSFVEWMGDVANPSFNITAKDVIRTTVTMADNTTSTVNFTVIVGIKNNLENLDLTFDLSADNLTIRNELQSMAAEQRSTQALSLLIYNTYTGPSSSARVDNNALNSFLSREINQWARNNLSGVDVSVGIDSVDDTASGGTEHTDYSYTVSKTLFNDRLRVSVGGTVSTGTTAATNAQNSVVDDISVEYRLTRWDNLYLRVFRYNLQESIFEGEIVRTGVGLLLRRKMDHINELFVLARARARRLEKRRRAMEERMRADSTARADSLAADSLRMRRTFEDVDQTEPQSGGSNVGRETDNNPKDFLKPEENE